jgi:glycosyltransferase involved in cell wall biosynthesis
MADAMDELLGDPEQATRLGAAARRHVISHFDVRQLAFRWLRLYERVMEFPTSCDADKVAAL